MKNILFVTGKSQYNSTRLFLQEIASTMERSNLSVDALTVYDCDDYTAKRKKLAKQRYDIIFTINGIGLEENSSLGKILLRNDTLYCTLMMDHPYIHHQRLQNQYGNLFVMCPDMEHAEYLNKYYPHIRHTAFLPHGGCRATRIRAYEEREIAVSFIGSYGSPEKTMNEILAYPPQMSAILQETICFILKHPQYSVNQAIYLIMKNKGVMDDKTNLASICPEFRIVDTYVRQHYRDQILRTIAEAGITVDVYGDGWEQMRLSNPTSLRIHPRVDYHASLEITGNTKLSLNVMPWFKAGSHDRIFTSMLCGSLCLTDSSSYLEQTCLPGENILFYELTKLDSLPMQITQALENPDTSSEIAANGQKLAKKYHTWENRAEQILKYLTLIEEND